MNYTEIGAFLAAERTKQKKTRYGLAKEVGCPEATIKQIEIRSNITVKSLSKICNALNIEFSINGKLIK